MNAALRIAIVLGVLSLTSTVQTQTPERAASGRFSVILLGTAGGPTINPERLGISTLVVAGSEQLLFDAGRGLTFGLARLSIRASTIDKIFLTHLHSDHIVSIPELFLFPWASDGRKTPLRIWGPEGTRAMTDHLREAFAFDIHARRDLDERLAPDGITILATDVREGVVYEEGGVKVTAFLVDHGPVTPAFGYRVDYGGHSVVLSGDTRPSDNLVTFARGADVLIHEIGRSKDDPALIGPADEVPAGAGNARAQIRAIAAHHTDAAEAARVFQRVNPRLVVLSHVNQPPAVTLATIGRGYPGRVEYGSDLMTIDIGAEIAVRPFERPARQGEK
jgi:ribonuclease Z